MPTYKNSKTQSKNGGRRKKRTLKNVRRGKSRKVMRGGAKIETMEQLSRALNKPNNTNFRMELQNIYSLLDEDNTQTLDTNIFNAIKKEYKEPINTSQMLNQHGSIKSMGSQKLKLFFNTDTNFQ